MGGTLSSLDCIFRSLRHLALRFEISGLKLSFQLGNIVHILFRKVLEPLSVLLEHGNLFLLLSQVTLELLDVGKLLVDSSFAGCDFVLEPSVLSSLLSISCPS